MKQKIYLDTSTVGAYFDEEKRERQELTKEFWIKLKNYDVYISEIVEWELSHVKDKNLRKKLLDLVKNFKKLILSKKASILAEEYIKENVIPKRFMDDANHVAIASANGMDILISWNFRHLVNIRTKRLVNLINLKMGYKTIEIISPPEL